MDIPRFVRALALVLLGLAALPAPAEPRIRIAATDPASPATLGRDEPFYLLIEYATEEPAQFWARPYFRGEALKKVKFNPSRPYRGTGTALGWFSLDEAGAVDEVRIVTGGGKPWRESTVLVHPVDIRGTGQPAPGRPKPPWVAQLQAEANAIHREELRREAAKSPSVLDQALFTGFMLAVVGLLVGSIAGPAFAVWKWTGAWRIAAAVPLVAMGFVLLRIVVDTARDPTSHNLWPFEILYFGAGSVAAVAVMALVRRLTRR